jgi:hypothetical protein
VSIGLQAEAGLDLARDGEVIRQRLAHADGLAALTRKNERDRHAFTLPLISSVERALCAEIGPKDTAHRVLSTGAASS